MWQFNQIHHSHPCDLSMHSLSHRLVLDALSRSQYTINNTTFFVNNSILNINIDQQSIFHFSQYTKLQIVLGYSCKLWNRIFTNKFWTRNSVALLSQANKNIRSTHSPINFQHKKDDYFIIISWNVNWVNDYLWHIFCIHNFDLRSVPFIDSIFRQILYKIHSLHAYLNLNNSLIF